MRHTYLSVLLILALSAGYFIPHVAAQPKGKSMTVVGELVDMWCYFEDGSKGAKHADCAKSCAKSGNPIGILQKDGKVFVLAGIKDHQPAKEVLIDHMGEEVTLKGTLVMKGGINMLYVESVTPKKGAAKAPAKGKKEGK